MLPWPHPAECGENLVDAKWVWSMIESVDTRQICTACISNGVESHDGEDVYEYLAVAYDHHETDASIKEWMAKRRDMSKCPECEGVQAPPRDQGDNWECINKDSIPHGKGMDGCPTTVTEILGLPTWANDMWE